MNTAQEKSDFSSVPFWTLLGPFLVFVTLILINPHAYFTIVSLVGLLLCYFWRWPGFLVSSLLLLFLQFVIPTDGWTWILGQSVCLISGYIVTILGAEQVESSFEEYDHSCETQKKNLENFHKELSKDKEKLIQEKEYAQLAYQEALRNLEKEGQKLLGIQQSTAKQNDELKRAREQIQAQQSHLLEWQARAEALQVKVADHQNEGHLRHKAEAEHQAKIRDYASQLKENEIRIQALRQNMEEVTAKLNAEVQQLTEELQKKPLESTVVVPLETEELVVQAREGRRYLGLYNQLKEQFAQKGATLDETRRELFWVKEQLSACKRESEERVIFARQVEQERLIDHILIMDKQLCRYEAENEALQNLVSCLTSLQKSDE